MSWLLSLIAPIAAYADSFNIQTSVPGPLDINEYGILGYIQNAYLLALAAAGALAIGSIVYGAVQYTVSRGNPSKLSDAWDRIVQALIGLLLLVGAGTLLSIVNPGLLSLELPKLIPVSTTFEADTFTGKLDVQEIKELDQINPNWRREKSGGKCVADTTNRTLCGVDNMKRCSAWDAREASAICSVESRGDAAVPSGVDRCTAPGGGPSVGFSMGLMQINLLAHYDKIPTACQGLFVGPSGRANDHSLGTCVKKTANGVCSQWSCKFVGTAAGMNACKEAFRANNGKIAIELGCKIYQQQSTANKWRPWPHTAAVACGYKSKFGSSGKYMSHPELYR